MSWRKNLITYVLASLYPTKEESYRIVDEAGIPKIHIAFRAKAIDNWHSILTEADKRGKVISIIQNARKDYPDNSLLEQAEKGELMTLKGPIIGEDIIWNTQQSIEPVEKIMGKHSTLLPISFLEIGLQRAKAVARIKLTNDHLGSGFIVKDNMFITNNHVLSNKDEAKTAIIQFNFQKTIRGLDCEPVTFYLDPDSYFATSVEDDWTLVRIQGNANADWGAIDMAWVNVNKTDRVNIIQHPGGGPKQIALYHNIVTYADEKRVQYLTDTLPGSSGSPVFNSQWHLIAIHHSGGAILEPETKKAVYRNEGININCIIKAWERD